MVGRVQMMAVSDLAVVRGFFMIAGLVMLGRFAMVLGRMLVVICSVLVMLVNLVTIHRSLPG